MCRSSRSHVAGKASCHRSLCLPIEKVRRQVATLVKRPRHLQEADADMPERRTKAVVNESNGSRSCQGQRLSMHRPDRPDRACAVWLATPSILEVVACHAGEAHRCLIQWQYTTLGGANRHADWRVGMRDAADIVSCRAMALWMTYPLRLTPWSGTPKAGEYGASPRSFTLISDDAVISS